MARNDKPRMDRDTMPVEQRAKQFMPFAAVVGLEEALRIKEAEITELYKPEYSIERPEGSEFVDD